MPHFVRREKYASRFHADWRSQVRLALSENQAIRLHGEHHNEAIHPPMWRKKLPWSPPKNPCLYRGSNENKKFVACGKPHKFAPDDDCQCLAVSNSATAREPCWCMGSLKPKKHGSMSSTLSNRISRSSRSTPPTMATHAISHSI